MSPVQRQLRFWHRIVQRQGKYHIQSVCVDCGQEIVAAATEEVLQWEYDHACDSPPAPCHEGEKQLDDEGWLRRVGLLLSRISGRN